MFYRDIVSVAMFFYQYLWAHGNPHSRMVALGVSYCKYRPSAFFDGSAPPDTLRCRNTFRLAFADGMKRSAQ